MTGSGQGGIQAARVQGTLSLPAAGLGPQVAHLYGALFLQWGRGQEIPEELAWPSSSSWDSVSSQFRFRLLHLLVLHPPV